MEIASGVGVSSSASEPSGTFAVGTDFVTVWLRVLVRVISSLSRPSRVEADIHRPSEIAISSSGPKVLRFSSSISSRCEKGPRTSPERVRTIHSLTAFCMDLSGGNFSPFCLTNLSEY